PSSRGKSSQRMPVLSTKRMPVSALRLSIGFRPGKRNRRGFGGGNNGSIRFQSSSGSRGLAISNLLRMVYLYYVEDTCQVRHFVSVSYVPAAARCWSVESMTPVVHQLLGTWVMRGSRIAERITDSLAATGRRMAEAVSGYA